MWTGCVLEESGMVIRWIDGMMINNWSKPLDLRPYLIYPLAFSIRVSNPRIPEWEHV